jgi:hypothetical protein
MASVNYLAGFEAITPAPMNALWGAFEDKLETVLGGRSFLLVNREDKTTFGNVGGDVRFPRYAGQPYHLLGKCFFFTAGATAFSQYLPGAAVTTTTVTHPPTGGSVTATTVRAYSHSVFASAVAAAVPTSWDTANRIVTVPRIGPGAYTNGLFQYGAIPLCEHSLQAHVLAHPSSGVLHFVKEAGCPVPEKRYEWAVAEIILEGQTDVTIESGWDKYRCFRLHNLQSAESVVRFRNRANTAEITVTLSAYECKTVRRHWNPSGNSGLGDWENYVTGRYFFTVEATDPRCFWFWPSHPSNTGNSYYTDPAVQATAVDPIAEHLMTAAGAMQASNIINPAQVYDWIAWMTDSEGTKRYAAFDVDVHELCDIGSTFQPDTAAFEQGKLACLRPKSETGGALAFRANAKVADMFWHQGQLYVRKTAKSPWPNTAHTLHTLNFKGVSRSPGDTTTVVSDFASAGIAVTTAAGGNWQLGHALADKYVFVMTGSTNILKNPVRSGDAAYQVLPTGFALWTTSDRYELENRVMEDTGVDGQDVRGLEQFNLGTRARYRITQRTVANGPAPQVSFYDEYGTLQVVTGDAPETLVESTPPTALDVTAPQTLTIDELMTLQHFGDSARLSQNDDYVSYSVPDLTLTPEGWVMTWVESVEPAPLPAITTAAATPLAPHWCRQYKNRYGNTYTYNAGAGKWQLKHAARFRKHGWGFGQWGRANAGFHSPLVARPTVNGYRDEVYGPDGSDFGVPYQAAESTGVKLLRQIVGKRQQAIDDTDAVGAGSRFFTTGLWRCLDGVAAYIRNSASAAWFNQWVFLLTGDPNQARATGGPSERGTTAMVMVVEHYNAMAQAVNQVKTARPLSWRAIRVPYGNTVLNFDIDPPGVAFTGEQRLWLWSAKWAVAPRDAFAIVHGTTGSAASWLHYLTAKGILKEAADMAGWSTYKVTANRAAAFTVATAATIELTSRTGPEGGRYSYAGDMDVTFGAVTWDTTDRDIGNAMIAVPGRVESVNLPEFTSAKWVTIGDFQTLVEDFGLTFEYNEVRVPLKLGVRELPDVSEVSGYLTGATGIECFNTADATDHTGFIGSTATAQQRIAMVYDDGRGNWTTSSVAMNWKKRVCFTLPMDSETANWKAAPLAYDVWNTVNRAPGAGPIRYSMHVGVEIHGAVPRVARVINLAEYNYGNRVTVLSPYGFSVDTGASYEYGLKDVNAEPLPFPDDGKLTGYTTIGGVEVAVHGGLNIARGIWEHDVPTEGTQALRDAETIYRYLEQSEMRLECEVVGDGVVTLYAVPVGTWGVEVTDWWTGDRAYMQSLMGEHTAAREWLEASGTPEVISCMAGVTEIAATSGQRLTLITDDRMARISV